MINIVPIKKSLQRYFNFTQGTYWNKTLDDFRADVCDAIDNNVMMPIVAPWGAGKNYLYDAAVAHFHNAKKNIVFVDVRNYYKEKLDISSIINAAIYDLSDESPRRDLEARSRQFTRIVGAKFVNEQTLVNILINEGHRLHSNTFRALKELREASFKGISPLFSVIITGHDELKTKIEARKEVLWRSQMLELNEANGYYTEAMRRQYVKKVFGEAVTPEAAATIAMLNKYPLQINYYIEQKMEEAKKAGKEIIDEEVVKPTTKQLYEALQFSYKQIAEEAGLGKTTVSDALHAGESHSKNEEVFEAIKRLHIKQGGDSKLIKKVS